jgi:glucose/arabinose dehydrogenase
MKKLMCLGLTLVASISLAQLSPGNGPASPDATILEPVAVKVKPELLSKLSVPEGFTISVFAENLGNARMMHVRPNGDIYLTRRQQGDVLLIRDTNNDGVADEQNPVAQNLKLVHGIAERDGKLYLVADRMVYTAQINDDGTLSQPVAIITDLPDSGQHSARTIGFGPDGMMYLGVGSTCNNCPDSNPENATLIRAMPDGSARNVYAKGLRHTIGFGWHPVSGVLYGFDQGSDWRGDDQPPEELNMIQANADYGWPWCYGDAQPDPFASQQPPGTTKGAYCSKTVAPELMYTAHAAAIGMKFYSGTMFPAEYQGDAFVAMRGSWNRSEPSGYKVVRVDFNDAGEPVAMEDFISDWIIEEGVPDPANPGTTKVGQFGRVAGVAVWTDGSLLVSEDQSGIIYRVTYGGATQSQVEGE